MPVPSRGFKSGKAVAPASVHFARLIERLPDALLVVDVPFLHRNEGRQGLRFHDGIAVDGKTADPVLTPFSDGDSQLNPSGQAVVGVVERAKLRLTDSSADIAPVPVEVDDSFGVLAILFFVIRATSAENRGESLRAVVLQHGGELIVREDAVAQELHVADGHPGPFGNGERHIHPLRRALDRRNHGFDLGELIAFECIQLADGTGDAAQLSGVDEGIDAHRQIPLLELVVDRGTGDAGGALVVDNLDALAFFHIEDDELSDDAVAESIVSNVNREVVQEAGVPQPAEVRHGHLFALVGVRNPQTTRGLAGTRF
jgi:hypothetical protein